MLIAQPVPASVPFAAEPVLPTKEPLDTEAQVINMATNATQPDVSPSPKLTRKSTLPKQAEFNAPNVINISSGKRTNKLPPLLL